MRKTLFALVVVAAALLPASASGVGRILDVQEGLPDFDSRTSTIAPSAAQLQAVSSLGARASWNRFGTPQSLIKDGGYLATGLGSDAVAASRGWISAHRALFKLTATDVSNLELVNDSRLAGGKPAHAVLFRQTFGDLPATQDGMITVGIASGKIAYVSSSASGHQELTGSTALGPLQAWLKAAANAGRPLSLGSLSGVHTENGWTMFKAAGFAQPQRVRLTAFPTLNQGARRAYETIVLDVQGGAATAYKYFVDAQTGAVLFRQNAVDHLAQTTVFQGSYTPTSCGPLHPFTVPAGTKTIDVVASASLPTNDIVLKLIFNGTVVGSSDVLFSPEAIHYAPTVLTPGTYQVQVCPFDSAQDSPTSYAGTFTTNDVVAPAVPYPPKWKFFKTNPPLDHTSTDTRIVGCWESSINGVPVPGCQWTLQNLAARFPWDVNTRSNTPTFTTVGNAANTAEAWGSPLTPAEPYRPVANDRNYNFPWKNVWYTSKCSPSNFTPKGNDIDASITNLFAGHNRFHDFAYFLGFTENNYNAQDNNFGNTAPGPYPSGRENDPEIGDAQAGAVSGGSPSYLGRDNANQITLNDGVPPITNQYLWQPIAAAFYPPCVDGDFDTSVFGHEYTHLISNRMVGGPDAGLTGLQAGAMGESWSDLDAEEYLHAYSLVNSDDWALGAYATGNRLKGIRDYTLSDNPLNYSDVGFDTTGPEVHADGEIWNGVNYTLRQALIGKYNQAYPASDQALQRKCADGKVPADRCPGNRRWIQIVYDAWLLMQPAVSMVDARDAYLAADQLVFDGDNNTTLWRAFAQRGLGQDAKSDTNEDTDPIPSFRSAAEPNEALVTFKVNSAEVKTNIPATIYVGDYEARVTPVADTDSSTPRDNVVGFVPGTYDFVVQAKGYGLVHFTKQFTAGTNPTVTVTMPRNWASKFGGASVTSTNGVNGANLIDDTESTDWARLGATPSVKGSQVTVALGGGAHAVKRVQVSALLHPANPNDPNDSGSQNRFSALRQFQIWTCSSNCSNNAGWSLIYTSPADAFPAVAPRPVAPDLTIRNFDVPDTSATHVRLVVLTNQCTGGPDFQGDRDSDPTNNSDCKSGSAQDENVRAAELEVFSGSPTVQ